MACAHTARAKVLTFDSCAMETIMASMEHASSDQLLGCSPSLPPAGCVELTPMDVFCASLGVVRWAFVFPTCLDASIVKAGLSHVMWLYPLLTGRVVRMPGTEVAATQQPAARIGVSYDLSQHGLQFCTATSPLTAADIVLPGADDSSSSSEAALPSRLAMHFATDMAVISEHMAPDGVDQMIRGPPLPLARAVMCNLAPSSSSSSEQGGTLLCIAVHHMLMDGTSLRMFMQDWAAACRALAHGGSAHIPAPPTYGPQCWDDLVQAARTAGVYTDGTTPENWCLAVGPAPTPITAAAAAAPTFAETAAAMLAPRTLTPCAFPFAPYTAMHFSKQHVAALKHAAAKQLHSAGAAASSTTTHQPSGTNASSSAQPSASINAPEAAVNHSSSHASSGSAWVSSNDAVCAALWRGTAGLSSHTPGKENCFLRVVDLRARLHLPAGVSLDKVCDCRMHEINLGVQTLLRRLSPTIDSKLYVPGPASAAMQACSVARSQPHRHRLPNPSSSTVHYGRHKHTLGHRAPAVCFPWSTNASPPPAPAHPSLTLFALTPAPAACLRQLVPAAAHLTCRI